MDLYIIVAWKQDGHLDRAIDGFQELLKQISHTCNARIKVWEFRTWKQLLKAILLKNDHDWMNKCLEYYQKWISSRVFVSRNEFEKRILSWIDWLQQQNNMHSNIPNSFMQSICQITLDMVNDNERIFFRIHLTLSQIALLQKDISMLMRELRLLKKSCKEEKGTLWLEIYSLEIQAYDLLRDDTNIKECYHRALYIKSAIPHPKLLAIIRKIGGKMHMRQGDWSKAKADFFESFKLFDEIGNEERLNCLKYLVIANMLTGSTIDIFDSPEAQPYRNHPEITILTRLVHAYQNNDVILLEDILKDDQDEILDSFMQGFLEPILYTTRSRAILEWIESIDILQNSEKWYTFETIAYNTRVSVKMVEDVLFSCVMEQKLKNVLLDQVNQRVSIHKHEKHGMNQELMILDSFMNIHNQLSNIIEYLSPKYTIQSNNIHHG